LHRSRSRSIPYGGAVRQDRSRSPPCRFERKTMFRSTATRTLLAGAALLSLALSACGGSSGEPAASAPASASGGGAAGGTIAIITVDPSNPYWKTEADVAKAEAEKLGYKTTVSANKNDPETQNQLI